MTAAPIGHQAPPWPIPSGDPHPTLSAWREEGPLHRLGDFDAWLVVSHAAALDALTGPGWSSDPARSPAAAARLGLPDSTENLGVRSMIFSDPPDHTRLRQSISRWLTPRSVTTFEQRMAAIAASAFDSFDPGAPIEIMSDIAYPVTLAVICEILDTGVELAIRLRDETPRMTAMIDPLASPAEVENGIAAATALMIDLIPLAAERAARPGGDLLSALLAAGLDADEAILMALLLLVAGHETTANLIGNAVAVLHDCPDALRSSQNKPVKAVVEELLRFEPPVQLTARVAIQPHDPIRAGDQVFVSIAAANRDPAVFTDPDQFRLDRPGAAHLSFGHGAHFCAGAALARMEAQQILRRLLDLDPPIDQRQLCLERGRTATFRRITRCAITT